MKIVVTEPFYLQHVLNQMIGRDVAITAIDDTVPVMEVMVVLCDKRGLHVRLRNSSVTKIIPLNYIDTVEDKGLAQ